ncbi:hypothetical protein BDP55DRAFT_625579 [Colletotrichum godetiae]|uniref:Uncharacterized protein n=1 Tax=Colletotrichum godetiae TaxID=1209918 RepID=A0AAJ0AZV0_9PEZI|nr:uncharacterized protein BDP55DRAFT_625579 [Colletotrichum godetiae]KAK1701344.1 hypothetical protein BDP55DRAFT_625579 [Colletotrichum godetiae]
MPLPDYPVHIRHSGLVSGLTAFGAVFPDASVSHGVPDPAGSARPSQRSRPACRLTWEVSASSSNPARRRRTLALALPTSKNPTRRLRARGSTLKRTQPQGKHDFDVFPCPESALTASYTFVLPHLRIPEYGPSAQPLSSEHASGRDTNIEA